MIENHDLVKRSYYLQSQSKFCTTTKKMSSAQQIPVIMLHALMMLLMLAATVVSQALLNCPSKCGEVEVPYPFGIGDGCSRDNFDLVCNSTGFNPPKLFRGTYEILEINLIDGRMRSNISIARDCYTKSGAPRNTGIRKVNLTGSPLSFSAEQNRFVVTGCDTLVYMNDPGNFATGCVSWCNNQTKLRNYTCSGIGCCQTDIPNGLKYFQVEFQTFNNHTRVWNFNPCSYAFMTEMAAFNFTTSLLSVDYTFERVNKPVVMDWSIEGETCEIAKKNRTFYACQSQNSNCFPSNNGLGYLCKCSAGYEGNPYLKNGCQDIDECKNSTLYHCYGNCLNTVGGYNCSCPPGYQSDDPKTIKCVKEKISMKDMPFYLKFGIGLGSGIFFLVLLGFTFRWGIQKQKMIKERQKFFKQNGGIFLKQQISSHRATAFKTFTSNEIRRATNNYGIDCILGKGANGTVYKGILDDKRVVAVKKSIVIDEHKSKEFAQEMFILSQINHVNVVKLLGCCLEVEVPMLVYEFIPKGTLFQCIHEKRDEVVFPLNTRLRIAAEAAEALAYLHSGASPPILHGDVKSSNILLDANYTTKVSDFGTSILATNEKDQLMTEVQGTYGYLDPEYFQSSKLSDKSDVYSFGVVLLELLTRKKALYPSSTDGANRSLAQSFIACMMNNKLLDILDPDITSEGLTEQLQKLTKLAAQCLRQKGAERPTMKEVHMELEALRRTGKHPWVPDNTEERQEIMILPTGPPNFQTGPTSSLSIETRSLIDINSGR